ncbi:ribonuclease P protein component [Marivirga sp. S37H4]|uniref:Ribonuclease P protein component n=1 Tax=Marivirga aurantiaca TaxID=2802615 RepID=A0A934X0I3_9BACT|nr:ribonuclease P protein component [Marivirga aurantiaca]MBK6266673.1 ribonuclease P protein component [Marivirga aurantiaca]
MISSELKDNSSFSFKKEERLSSKKIIKELFDKGSSFYLFPFKVIYLENSLAIPNQHQAHQVLITVPKRKFKKAVDRNPIKRKIRESYRLQKHLISPKSIKKSFWIAYIYTTDKDLPYSVISEKLKMTLQRLKETVNKPTA